MTVSFFGGTRFGHPTEEVKINLDNAGAVLTPGEGTSFYTAVYTGRVLGWYITGNPAGSIVIDVRKKNGAIPTIVDSITGGDKPTLVNQQINSNTILTAWNSLVLPGDIFGISIDSVSLVTSVVLVLHIERYS